MTIGYDDDLVIWINKDKSTVGSILFQNSWGEEWFEVHKAGNI